ncbi:regulatory protein RecX [Frigoriflavimonas asaccharolytica]|uniref:Regulatory protein RecX n=1 Tax=Frigoriflavimonas asaccharolytica TaxID=2735899 RepID=A0A8J8G543_9FLAO|nr:regulatory protein RecX [Frigoriflavimonas asaccharolytica]NRS91236.1 regulatory protein [Frigoriflavimonas asaccharolytica]
MEKKLFTFKETKQKLADYCVYQDRCHQEVEQKMWEYVLIPEAKDEILLYLIQENFLNEERFTRSYIRGKFYMKSWGRTKIKSHLKFKGISEKLINSCWDEIDEADYQKTLEKVYNKYYATLKGLKEYQKKMKTTKYLMTRGYEYQEILKLNDEDN